MSLLPSRLTWSGLYEKLQPAQAEGVLKGGKRAVGRAVRSEPAKDRCPHSESSDGDKGALRSRPGRGSVQIQPRQPQLALLGQSGPAAPFRPRLAQSWQAAHLALLLPAVLALRMEEISTHLGGLQRKVTQC